MTRLAEAVARAWLAVRIWWWKRQARRSLDAYGRRSGLSCGAGLTDYIRPDVNRHYQDFQRALEKLRALDPKYPQPREC